MAGVHRGTKRLTRMERLQPVHRLPRQKQRMQGVLRRARRARRDAALAARPATAERHGTVNLRAATIGCPDAALQMLVFMGIRAQLDAFELRRADVLASVWQAQVTVVDIPGNGHGYARLTSAERAHLRTGRFDTVADRMVAAAVEHHPRLKHSPVVALGYSMGASLATAAAARSNTLRINRLVLVEPVANRRWSISELLRSVRAEQAYVEADLDRNHNGDNDA